MTGRLRVLWVTNFAAPYRRPAWSALGELVDLTIVLTGRPGQVQAANRGKDWFEAPDLSVIQLREFSFRLGGHDVIVASGGIHRLVVEADVVVLAGWESPIYWQFLRAGRRLGKRLVGFYESTRQTHRFSSGPVARARRRFFRTLDITVTPGEATNHELRRMGIPNHKICTGFNAVDVAQFYLAASRVRAESDEDKESSGHRFIYVGQLIPRKNISSLLEAFAQIRQPGDTLDLVGEGQEQATIERKISALGLTDSTRLLGAIPYIKLPALLAHYHTLVLPSLEEVWGLVVNEALAAGLHSVVSDSAGAAPSVRHMRGVFVAPPTVAGLASAMRESQDSWHGWVKAPEVLKYTPTAFAEVFFQAISDQHIQAVCSSRLLVVQPYVPKYRVAFFERLQIKLRSMGIDLAVGTPKLGSEQEARADEASVASQVSAPGLGWQFSIGGHTGASYAARSLFSEFDAIVLPATASLLDAHFALWGPGRRSRAVGLWGHIDSYVNPPNALDLAIEKRMMRAADHVFAYTTRGAEFAIRQGVPPQHVTALENTIDTEAIEAARAGLLPEDVEMFRRTYGIQDGRVFGFVGGLDASKGVAFLAALLDEWWAAGEQAQIVIAGRGAQESLLATAAARGQAVLVGYADELTKALIAATVEALVIPGRIGLVAVDAMTLGVPIATVEGSRHAPEADYLREGTSIRTGPADTREFGRWLLAQRFEYFVEPPPILDDMVNNFAYGIVTMIDTHRRRA